MKRQVERIVVGNTEIYMFPQKSQEEVLDEILAGFDQYLSGWIDYLHQRGGEEDARNHSGNSDTDFQSIHDSGNSCVVLEMWPNGRERYRRRVQNSSNTRAK